MTRRGIFLIFLGLAGLIFCTSPASGDCPPCKPGFRAGRRTLHMWQETAANCGPTSMQMWLYDKWGSCPAQDYVADVVTNRQGYEVSWCNSGSVDCHDDNYNCCSGNGTSIGGFMWGIYDFTPAGVYFNCWYYSNAPDAVDDACWACEYWSSPVGILCYHGGHWMDLRGFRSTGSVVRTWPDFYVCGVWIEDPVWRSPCFPGQGWSNRTYISAQYFMNYIFNDVSGNRYLITRDDTQGQWLYSYYGFECP
jgi:hypothetical protein